jgi:hypothetical protein
MALVVFALVIWIEIYFGRDGRSLVVSLELMDKSKGSSWNVVWWSLTDLLDSGIGSFLLRSIGVPVGMLVTGTLVWLLVSLVGVAVVELLVTLFWLLVLVVGGGLAR